MMGNIILWFLAGPFIVAISSLYIYARFFFRMVSTGPYIGNYPNPKKALLVIDVQENYTGRKVKPGFKNVDSMMVTINQLIDHAQQLGWMVVYIGQEFPNTFLFRLGSRKLTVEGRPGTELDARLVVVNNNYFPKSKADAFSNPALDQFLRENQVSELYLVGLDAIYGVYLTARGALNRKYTVTVIRDAVVTRSRRKLETIIRDYYVKAGIRVRSSGDILRTDPAARPKADQIAAD